MSKHTSGPWKWEYASHLYGGDEPGERQVLAGPNDWVLSTHPDDDKIIVTPEDAALIAAAPEMLELLWELEEVGEQGYESCPSCAANLWRKGVDHVPGCKLAALLRRLE